ncbi:MAG: ATP-binding protein, partial [Spirochaetia bacterium]|nr:ATP-binding protein [Spirochaetia bacterium]
ISLVEQEIDRLNAIVVDFLFAVRPMDITLIHDRADEVVREVAELMSKEAESQNIRVITKFDADLPDVMIDRKYLKQALLNIVKNAIAAMPEGGTLTISVSVRNDELLIAVSDTGIGIPEELLAKIFEPYFTTKESGTGLGLTITFKIIKEHNGEITVESSPGIGSTFTIHLPIPQPEQKSLPPWEDGVKIDGSHTED